MKKIITWSALFIISFGSGCATTIQVTNRQGKNIGQEQTQHVNRWAWGLWNGSVNKPDCPNGLHTVTATTTFSEKLVTIVTLGIYCPVDVTWYCSDRNNIH